MVSMIIGVQGGKKKRPTLKIIKCDKCPKFSGSNKLLSLVYYHVHNIIKSSKLLCQEKYCVQTCI